MSDANEDEKEMNGVLAFLASGPRHLDDMVQQLKIPADRLAGVLLTMEMERVVRRLPGNRFEVYDSSI